MSGGVGKFFKTLDLGSNEITNIANATADTSAVSRVQARGENAWKKQVRAATVVSGTLSTSFANGQTVDGVTLATGDDVLLKNQSTGSENGIYTVNASGAPTRRADFSSTSQAAFGCVAYVTSGTANAGSIWTMSNTSPPTMGTTALTFISIESRGIPLQFSFSGTLSTGTGSFRVYNDSGATLLITAVRISVGVVPTGSSIICDINKDGTTIFTTQANRPAIAASANTSGKVTNMDVTDLADGSYVTVDVDQVGSTIPGGNLTAQVWCS